MLGRITAAFATFALAVTGLLVGPANATTSQAFVHTVRISNNVDSGSQNSYWAWLNFNRTVAITKTAHGATPEAADTYRVVLTDSGSLRTIKGANSPGAGTPITRSVPGTFAGSYTFTVTSASEPTHAGVRSSYNYGCQINGTCTKPSSTDDWSRLYFKDATVTVTPNNDWRWTYRTCSERWVNANPAVGGNSGDVTGKRCDTDVTPAEPTVAQPACDARRGVLTIPSVRGVSYSVNNRVWRAGPHDVFPGVYRVTASVRDGYEIPRGDRRFWVLTVKPSAACPTPTPTPTVTPKPTPTPSVTPTIPQTPVPSPSVSPAPVTPKEPVVEQPTCATEGVARITIPEVEGVVYSPETSGIYVVQPGEVKVTAAAAEGYTLADNAETEWTRTVNAPPTVCPGPAGEDGADGKDGKTVTVNGVPVPSRIDTGLGGTA